MPRRVIASSTFIVALLFGAWGALDRLVTVDARRDLLEPDAMKAARPVLRGPRPGMGRGYPTTATIIPIVKPFAERHDLADMVVIADAGMLSAANLTELDDADFRFIVGSRVTKAPVDLESHFRWHGDAFADGQVIDTLAPKTRRGGKGSQNDSNLRAEPVWEPGQHPGWRAVRPTRPNAQSGTAKTLTLQENRAKEVIAGEKSSRTPRFMKTSNGEKTLDEAALAKARRLVDLKGVPMPRLAGRQGITARSCAVQAPQLHGRWARRAGVRPPTTRIGPPRTGLLRAKCQRGTPPFAEARVPS